MKIVENDKTILMKINKALAKELNTRFKKKQAKLSSLVKSIVWKAVFFSPECQSLSNGTLKLDFGLTQDPASLIADAVSSSVVVLLDPISVSGGSSISGGIKIYIQPNDYSNLLGSSFSRQAIESGGSIPWLEWLLLAGDSIIIADFGVEYSSQAKGRAGPARMSKSEKPFKVDSQFSGTKDNNFITRALKKYFLEIEKAITGVLK